MRRTIVILALLSTLPLAARAADLGADEIVDRYVEARGGLAAIRAIDALVYSGGVYREADFVGSGNAFMAFARPYLRVVGDPDQPGDYLEGYDGAAWEWSADPGVVIRTVGAAAGATRRGADFEGWLVGYREKGSTVDLAGREAIDGRDAYRVILTLRDGFVRELFIDTERFLIVAERASAPLHAFGPAIDSETRVEDYRSVGGVLFPHRFVETEVGSGRPVTSMQWGRIEAARTLPRRWFSPPVFERTPLQAWLEGLYGERTDAAALLWSYADFRRFHPNVATDRGIQFIGYQILKMGEIAQAVALLEANAADHPDSAGAAFGLGRAYAEGGEGDKARSVLGRALALDPGHERAARLLESLGGASTR